MELAWKFLIENESRLRSMCRNACRGSTIDPDDAWCDVCVARMPRIAELYDETVGELWPYAANNLRLYLQKYVAKRMGEPVVLYDHYDQSSNPFEQEYEVEYIQRIRVLEVLDSVDDQQRLLLVLKFFHGLTFEEMALFLGCSVGNAYKRYTQALRTAMENMGVEP